MSLPYKPHTSWRTLLAEPARPTHMVQLCESDDALACGAAFFTAEGLRRGEAVVLTGTRVHIQGIRQALRSRDVDFDSALASGQLTVGDAHEAVEAVTVNGLPDRARFEAIAGEVLAKVSADPRFRGVRWWGEMSNVFHSLGNRRGVTLDEEIGDAICRQHEVSLLCTFQCDRFDPASYDGLLQDVCCRHSHVIHADNYGVHRHVVNRAVAEVIGELDSAMLRSLVEWKGMPGADVPSSQAALFWLREGMPQRFAEVLARARLLYVAPQAEAQAS